MDYKTRYYVVNKAGDGNNDGPMSSFPIINNRTTDYRNDDDDDEDLFRRREPDHISDDIERRKNAALIGFELTIPSMQSSSQLDMTESSYDSGEENITEKNVTAGAVATATTGTTTAGTTRRVGTNRRAALRQGGMKKPTSNNNNNNTSNNNSSTVANNNNSSNGDASNTPARPTLIKSESRRGLMRSESKRGFRSLSSESIDRRGAPSIQRSRSTSSTQQHLDHNTSLLKTSQRVGSSNNANTNTTKDPETQLYELLNNVDPLKSRQKILDEEKIVELMEKYPKICSKKFEFYNIYTSGDTTYPLHMLCCYGLSLSAIKLCYKLYAEAIDYISATREMTCLHYAVLYTRAPIEVVQFIMKKDPAAISAFTKKQLTPLHIACSCSPNIKSYNPKVIMILTELANKEVLCEVDRHGRTPLHIACGLEDPCLEVIEDLTEVNPDACVIPCYAFQSTPLHLACANRYVCDENHAIVEVIRDLLSSNPAAVKMKDINGQLPITVAVTNKACYKVCKMLIKKYPECLEMTDSKGMTLYELGRKRQLDEPTIDLLNPYDDD